jgi:hypothetical protein
MMLATKRFLIQSKKNEETDLPNDWGGWNGKSLGRVRRWVLWLAIVSSCFSLTPKARGADTGHRGMAFEIGFESYPGRLYYRLDGFRYINGTLRDVKYRPSREDITFRTFSFRATGLVRTGFPHLRAGLEVGISLPASAYGKSWDVPALTPKLTQDFYFPSFC